MLPNTGDFRLPDSKTFLPTQMSAYSRPITATTAVGPADLVDAQGFCSGAAVGSNAAASARGVTLEMTECDVVRTLGPPQRADIGAEGATRIATLTYMGGERPGIYRFVGGRLSTIDRGSEPQEPAVAKKPPPKKPKPPAPPPA